MTRSLLAIIGASLAGVTLASLCACASHPAASPPPGTQPAYSIDCSGSGQTWDDCYKKAQLACGGSYDVVSRPADRTLVVSCRKSAVGS